MSQCDGCSGSALRGSAQQEYLCQHVTLRVVPAAGRLLRRGAAARERRAPGAGPVPAAGRRRARRRLRQAQDDDAQGEALPLLVQHLLRRQLRGRRARAVARRQ